MLAQRLQQAAALLQTNDYQQALDALTAIESSGAASADFWQLLALAHKGLGQLKETEVSYLKSVQLLPQPHVLTNLANFYRQQRRPEEAETRYRQALSLDSNHLPARVNYGQLLLEIKQFEASAQQFSAALEYKREHLNAQIGLAQALQQLGDQESAFALFEEVLSVDANNASALNGLGISLKTFGHGEEAVLKLQKAHQLAPNSAEILLNLASALAVADRSQEAVAAYEAMLTRDPDNPELHAYFNGYLGVIRHPDYLKSYDKALERHPGDPRFAVPLARRYLLENRGQDALQVLETAFTQGGESASLNCELSHVLREQGEFVHALKNARSAVNANPSPASQRELATALMAAGADYQEAHALLTSLVERFPVDQGLWALYATALRYTENAEAYRSLVDHDRMIQVREISCQQDYAILADFIDFIRQSLLRLHITKQHPVEQSMLHGTQTLDDLFSRREPAIQQLTAALGEQLTYVIDALPKHPAHPLYGRNTGQFNFSNSWSVRLWRDGFHKNHFHSQGWLSSAFYLAVPPEVAQGGEGWIKFGEPGFRAREPLGADYWVKPKEGALVVFPSYLWHGTEPLYTASERMTVGYDILPSSS
ncbi:MAG: putative 2OG-Fe(II) oxygenase [Luminiphilus sp.]|nr:putative 2OG-Fe(II) oxygenase [Luminiphilus sp.]